MKSLLSMIVVSLLIVFNITVIAQNKLDSRIIKTSIPENPIVSIKNDVYDPETESVIKDLKNNLNQKSISFNSVLNKDFFDAAIFESIIHNGNVEFLAHYVVTEQFGAAAGTIWVVAGVRTNSPGQDNVFIFKFGPTSWEMIAAFPAFGYLGYEMDAEIIEKSTGEKVLWFVTERRQGLATKRESIYGVLGITVGGASLGAFSWPGAGPNDEYYNPRITTDNSFYNGDPWIFVVASVDSMTFDNKHVNAQKFAYITNPGDAINFQINYRPQILPIYWPNGGTTEIHHLYSDIAYLHLPTNESKLIFTYSNVPDDTRIWLSSCSMLGTNAMAMGTIDGNGNYKIGNSAITSPGGLHQEQLMVVFEENYLNSGDWDLVSARSNDAGITWNLNYIDSYSSTTTQLPNIGTLVCRQKSLDEFYLSYSLNNPADSIMSVKSNNDPTVYWDSRIRMSITAIPHFIKSSVGFTNTSPERLAVWSSEPFSTNFSLIGSFWPDLPSSADDELETIVNSYQLYQNYPNPFNPSTKISWRSPVGSWQTLKVYDLLGREVETLVDEYKPAGRYEVEFSATGGSASGGDAYSLSSGTYFYRLQAGEFFETKKLILLK